MTEILMCAPMPPLVIDGLAARFTLHKLWEHADTEAALSAIAPRIRGLAASTLAGPVAPALLDRLPALEIIASFGVGYEHVDAGAAADRGIIVTNTPGVLDDEVADCTIGLLLATLRCLPQADRFVRAGLWRDGAFPLSPSLRGRRIGLLGFGNIGQAIARRLAGFGVPIAYHARHPRPDTPYDYYPTPVALAEVSDVLIAILPGGDATRHIVNADVLAALGADGVLINVARGSVVDQPALIAALQQGTILAAGLDVFEEEPEVPQALIDMENVVLLPHVGSASERTRAAMGQLVVDNLVSWFAEGRPITPVFESERLLNR
ncbi:lactate dehydrogenase-like 2-hydroxyacid dehydrogenase [Sphingomonas vulcanisoli]|uniref:Lactate dehydrogenase-like 2-hydroxyacid dehydrogenase n=1 Tax=Sphingomonas vulcanisoli TaxID=1658060 RepID=A0ABX0TY04_9SPHN|nr:2-hydroxyacid dehydrogenase [Sphingomonas vulcanisoli]NIJ09079.1 lactate dehydrogenase-like 2-hydroxyacid dehydrogenase [Sphingomonas vulcanisoli]